MSSQTEVQSKQESPLLNLLFNIVLPVIILNQVSKRFGDDGPLLALILGLALPIGYGFYDYIKRKKHNYISALGVANVAVTGGFALMELEGLWFAVKEAFFPLIIGLAVLVGNHFGKSVLQAMFWNENVLRIQKIDEIIKQANRDSELKNVFYKSTNWFAASFFLSSFLNFVLASRIFLPIDPNQPSTVRQELLNGQIAQMTWLGYVVIALPMMVIMGLILWYIVSRLKALTGLKIEELLAGEHSPT